MALTLRLTKGLPLTHKELDDNFQYLSSSLASVATSTSTGSFLYSGSFDGENTVTLYSADTNYDLDLSALISSSNFTFSGSFPAERVIITGNTSSAAPGGMTTSENIRVWVDNGGFAIGGSQGLNGVQGAGLVISETPDNGNHVILSDGSGSNLNLRAAGGDVGDSYVVILADQAGTTDADIYEIAKFGGTLRGTELYHTGSLVFHTTEIGANKAVVVTGTVSASAEIYFPGLAETTTPHIVGFDTASGQLTYYSTASFGTSIDTGSFLLTGSVLSNVLTFTKGDGTTFNLTVDTGSAGGGGGTIDGTGVARYITRWVDADTITTSSVYENTSGQIGIGTANPLYTAHIKAASNTQLLIESDNDSNIAGIKFKTEDTDTDVRIKGGIFFDNTGADAYGRGDLIFATEYGTNDTNVSPSDWNLKIDNSQRSVAISQSLSVGTDVFKSGVKLFVEGNISGSGDVYFSGLPNTTTANIVGFDAATGQLSYYSTASFSGGGGTPTLDAVTTAGNTTGNSISINTLTALNNGWFGGTISASLAGVGTKPTNGNFEVKGISYQAGRVLFPELRSLSSSLSVLAIQTGSLGTFGELTTLDLSTFVTASDTGSLLYSASYDSGTNELVLYSADLNYNIDLSGLAGGAGGFAITASDEGIVKTENARSFDFVGNAVEVTNSGNAVTVTINQADTGSFIINDQTSSLFVGQALNTAITVKNMHTGTIQKGMPCYITGSGTNGNVVGVVPADAVDDTYMPAGVVLAQELTNPGDEGIGYINGWINGVDTSAFNSGDDVYVAVGGGYTNIKPTGSALIQKLGNVEKVHISNGSGVIVGAGRANDLPNINPGHFWVGNNDWVPQAVSTASFVNSLTYTNFTGSTNSRLDSLQAATSSYVLNSQTSSFLDTIYNTDGNLTNARTITAAGNNLTFDVTDANFTINSAENYEIIITGLEVLPDTSHALVWNPSNGYVSAIATSSIVDPIVQEAIRPLNSATSSYVQNSATSSFVRNSQTSSFLDTVYNTNGTLTGDRTVTLGTGNDFTFTPSAGASEFRVSDGPAAGPYSYELAVSSSGAFKMQAAGAVSASFDLDVTVESGKVFTLKPQHPLPSALPGAFAVSSSIPPKPYFYDGTSWNALY